MDFSKVRSCLLLITLVEVSGNADLSTSYMNHNDLANEAVIEDMLVSPFGSISLIEQQEDAYFKPSSSNLSPNEMCALLKLGAEQTDDNDNRESYKCLIEQSCTPKGKQQENQIQAGLCKYISTLKKEAAAWMKAYQKQNCRETSTMAEDASQDAEKESVECYSLTPVMKCKLYELGMSGHFTSTSRSSFKSKFNKFCSTQGRSQYCNQMTKTLDNAQNMNNSNLFRGPQQHLFTTYTDFCLPEGKQVAEEGIASLAFEHGYTKVRFPGNPHHLVDASQQVSDAIAQESTAVSQQNEEFSKQSSEAAAESTANDQQVAREETTMVQAAKAAALNKVHVAQAVQSPEMKTRQAQEANTVTKKQRQTMKHTKHAVKQQSGERHTKHEQASFSKASPTGHHSKIANIAIQQKKFDMRQQVYRQKKEQLIKEVGADKAELKRLDAEWATYERTMESKGVCAHSCTAWEDTENSKGQDNAAFNNKEDKTRSKGQHNRARNMTALKDNAQVNPTTMSEQSAFYEGSGSIKADSSSAETSSTAEHLNGLLEFLTDFE